MPFGPQLAHVRALRPTARRALLALHHAGALERRRHQWHAADQLAAHHVTITGLQALGLVRVERRDRAGRRARAHLTPRGAQIATQLTGDTSA